MYRITQEELSDLIMDNRENMYRLAYSIVRNDADTQEAVSEAVVLAFEKRHQLRKRTSAKAWIMQILVNASKRILVQSKRIILSGDENQFEQTAAFAGDEMWAVIMELDEEFKEVIVLYYYEQFSVKEISKILKIPEGTIKSRLSRARKKLSKIIE